MDNCNCGRICRLKTARISDGPYPGCNPAEHYFFVVRDGWTKSADGDAEWDGSFIPGRHATFEKALEVVAAEPSDTPRYVIEEVPRFTAFAKWSGHPDQARKLLAGRIAA